MFVYCFGLEIGLCLYSKIPIAGCLFLFHFWLDLTEGFFCGVVYQLMMCLASYWFVMTCFGKSLLYFVFWVKYEFCPCGFAKLPPSTCILYIIQVAVNFGCYLEKVIQRNHYFISMPIAIWITSYEQELWNYFIKWWVYC